MSRGERALADPGRVFDVPFAEFMCDEIGMVRRLYHHFGLALTPEAEARMRRFLAANRRNRHGTHRYTLAAAGLDATTERRRYVFYQERRRPRTGPGCLATPPRRTQASAMAHDERTLRDDGHTTRVEAAVGADGVRLGPAALADRLGPEPTA